MTILDLAEDSPDAPCLDDSIRRRSRGELIERAARVAHLLRDELGVEAGGHVAMVMGNRAEFVELCLGALLAGVWMTPVNWHLTAGEVRYVLADSGARAVFAGPEHETLAREAADVGLPVVSVGAELEAMLAAASNGMPDLAGTPGGNMFYTSGTTGRPKGVKRARARSIREALELLPVAARRLGLDGRGPHLVTGPLYHAAPLGFAVMDQHAGAELVLMPRFDATAALGLIAARRIRNTHLVPTMFVRLLRLPEASRADVDVSSLHTVLHGAAPVSPTVKRRMIDWWGPVLLEYWGASEGGVVTLTTSKEWLEHPGTVGRAITAHEVWAADGAGRRLPAGEVGLLWCRNERLAEVFRYHGDEGKTARATRGPGEYTLGDIGHVDANGWVYLADRAAHTIISGGVNIYPAEIEHVLAEHPAVGDVAVFGVPDEEWGEAVLAAVEPAPGVEWTPEVEASVLRHARAQLASYKVPKALAVHERLPRSDTGKLAVRVLRAPYWEGRERSI